MRNLPIAQPHFPPHTQEARNTDARRVTDGSGTERKLPHLKGHTLTNFGKGVDIHNAAEQSLPEDDEENQPNIGNETEERLEREEQQIDHLQQRGDVDVVNAQEWSR